MSRARRRGVPAGSGSEGLERARVQPRSSRPPSPATSGLCPVKRSPTGSNHRVGNPACKPYEPGDPAVREPKHEPGRYKPDERATGDIAGVVEADENPADADHRRPGEEESSDPSTDKRDGACDRKRCNGMVARKRRLMRGRQEQEGVMRVGVEWARTLVEVRDDLAEREPQPSGREARQAGDLPSVPRPGPVEQPKREGCDGEQRDRERADEVADLVCDKRVPV